jgi:hypothetical protein
MSIYPDDSGFRAMSAQSRNSSYGYAVISAEDQDEIRSCGVFRHLVIYLLAYPPHLIAVLRVRSVYGRQSGINQFRNLKYSPVE